MDNWTQEEILSHEAMDLSLKSLLQEREKIIKFNEKISDPNYQFKDAVKKGLIKVTPVEAIDKFIRLKQDSQLKLEL